MKAIVENDSSDMSVQSQAPINLHKWRGSDGEIQSEDVQEERERVSLWTEYVPTTLQVSPLLYERSIWHSLETQTHNFKNSKPSVTTGLESASDRIRAART